MFAEQFIPLITQHPTDADALQRLADYFLKLEKSHGAQIFDARFAPREFFHISQAGAASRLARILAILIQEGLLGRCLTVNMPNGESLKFKSWADVPDSILDPAHNNGVELTLDNVEVTYHLVTR